MIKSKILNELTDDEIKQELTSHGVKNLKNKNLRLEILKLYDKPNIIPQTEIFNEILNNGYIPSFIFFNEVFLSEEIVSLLSFNDLLKEAKNQDFDLETYSSALFLEHFKNLKQIKFPLTKKFSELIIKLNSEKIKNIYQQKHDKRDLFREIKISDLEYFSKKDSTDILELNDIYVSKDMKTNYIKDTLYLLFQGNKNIKTTTKLNKILEMVSLRVNNKEKLKFINKMK